MVDSIVKAILILGVAAIAGCASPKYAPVTNLRVAPHVTSADYRPAPTPKKLPALEVRSSAGTFIFSTALAQAILPEEDTNIYTYYPLTWNHPGPVDRYRLYYGPAPGFYTNMIEVGATNYYEFSRTNWVGAYDRHFFVVTALRIGLESDYSRELPLPPYPHTHYTLFWTNPAPMQIFAHTNMAIKRDLWPRIAQTAQGTTNFSTNMPSPYMFFDVRRFDGSLEPRAIRTYNPLN